ncbi:MAG: hypothetical protein M1827_005196 [Pycnora praestabilis]|nr:MAG: hypothetical protein M1827_005196 [Pycnora praestabilis]
MWNPLYAVFPPLLVILSLPLATFAVFTTTFAFTVLLLRVLAVYFELGLALLHSSLFTSPSPRSIPIPTKQTSRNHPSPSPTPQHHHRRNGQKRRKSSTSSASALPDSILRPSPSGDIFSALVLGSGAGLDRDFEGVGGWAPMDEGDAAVWTSMNRRLELPAAVPHHAGGERRKPRWKRSMTSSNLSSMVGLEGGKLGRTGGGSGVVWSPMFEAMSAGHSRARTPPAMGTISPEGYFNMHYLTRAAPGFEIMGKEGSATASRKGSTSSTGSSGSPGRKLHLVTT